MIDDLECKRREKVRFSSDHNRKQWVHNLSSCGRVYEGGKRFKAEKLLITNPFGDPKHTVKDPVRVLRERGYVIDPMRETFEAVQIYPLVQHPEVVRATYATRGMLQHIIGSLHLLPTRPLALKDVLCNESSYDQAHCIDVLCCNIFGKYRIRFIINRMLAERLMNELGEDDPNILSIASYCIFGLNCWSNLDNERLFLLHKKRGTVQVEPRQKQLSYAEVGYWLREFKDYGSNLR